MTVCSVTLIPLSILQANAQATARTDQSSNPSPAVLLQAYKYAFHVFAGDDAQAAALEYKGESGAATRDSLRLQLNLTSEQFRSFENAALDYREAVGSTEDRISAVAQADRELHPRTKGLSAEAKARIHSLFTDFVRSEASAIDSIHQALDPANAQQLDEAVANFFAKSLANNPRSRRRPMSPRLNPPGLAPAANTEVQSGLGTLGPDSTDPGGGGGFYCQDYTDQQQLLLENGCEDDDGGYDFADCVCNVPTGGGGTGGSGGSSPSVKPISGPSVLPISYSGATNTISLKSIGSPDGGTYSWTSSLASFTLTPPDESTVMLSSTSLGLRPLR